MKWIFSFVLLVSILQADTVELKEGWQLVGLSVEVDVDEVFDSENVEIVWGFDASTQSWAGYSPDTTVMSKVNQTNLVLEVLEAYQAVWVKSKKDWSLSVQEKSELEAKNSHIKLFAGWNLVSIPQNSVASSKIFQEEKVWSYSLDGNWSTNLSGTDFPSLESVEQYKGLWVNSAKDKTIDLSKALSQL